MFAAPAPAGTAAEMPLYRDVAMDYQAGRPRWSGGNPVIAYGLEAVKGWAWRAVQTARYQYAAFTWNFGCELQMLVGQPYRAESKLSEAERYVTEALLVNTYIREARASNVRFEGGTLHMRVWFRCVYGEEAFHV